MHNTYFDAVYDGCHVLFLVYLSCEMGDNRGIWNSTAWRSAYMFYVGTPVRHRRIMAKLE